MFTRIFKTLLGSAIERAVEKRLNQHYTIESVDNYIANRVADLLPSRQEMANLSRAKVDNTFDKYDAVIAEKIEKYDETAFAKFEEATDKWVEDNKPSGDDSFDDAIERWVNDNGDEGAFDTAVERWVDDNNPGADAFTDAIKNHFDTLQMCDVINDYVKPHLITMMKAYIDILNGKTVSIENYRVDAE
jgi:hypothetical protein